MEFIKENKVALVAIVIAVIALFTPVQGKSLFGQITDTSFFDVFDATTGYKLAGTTFLSSTGLTLPTGATSIVGSGVTSVTYGNYTATYAHASLNTASTTVCTLGPSPAATTTLASFAMNVTTSTSSAGTLLIGTSTAQFNAATTSLSSFGTTHVFAANAQGTFFWDPGSADIGLVSPSTYVEVVTTNGSTVNYGYTYGGTCAGTFQSVN